jgi:hypothetical protein
VVGAGVVEQGGDDGGGLLGDGGGDGGLVGFGAVEGVDLERGVDACPEVGGGLGEQGGGVGEFVYEGRVGGGAAVRVSSSVWAAVLSS